MLTQQRAIFDEKSARQVRDRPAKCTPCVRRWPRRPCRRSSERTLRSCLTGPPIVCEYIDAYVDALVTDVHLGTRNELPDVRVTLPAKRAPLFWRSLGGLLPTLKHGAYVRPTPSPAARLHVQLGIVRLFGGAPMDLVLQAWDTLRCRRAAKGGMSCDHKTTSSTACPPSSRVANGGRGYPSETHVRRGLRVVHGDKELLEKLGRNDLCPCSSGRHFQELLPRIR
jgi:hypothetical protein